jgi:hypothetical protein
MELQQDTEIVELPTSFTKRSLYGTFLYNNGWKYKINNMGLLMDKIPVKGVEQKLEV